MNSYQKQLNDMVAHDDKMTAGGVKHGKYMSLSDLTHNIILNDITEVSEVLKIITEMQAQIKLGEG